MLPATFYLKIFISQITTRRQVINGIIKVIFSHLIHFSGDFQGILGDFKKELKRDSKNEAVINKTMKISIIRDCFF
jgi:hypothetical protein